MNVFLIGFVALIYLAVSIKFFINGQVGMGIAFAGYAFSNVGLMMVN